MFLKIRLAPDCSVSAKGDLRDMTDIVICDSDAPFQPYGQYSSKSRHTLELA